MHLHKSQLIFFAATLFAFNQNEDQKFALDAVNYGPCLTCQQLGNICPLLTPQKSGAGVAVNYNWSQNAYPAAGKRIFDRIFGLRLTSAENGDKNSIFLIIQAILIEVLTRFHIQL